MTDKPLAELLPKTSCNLRWRLADSERYQEEEGDRTLYLEKKVATVKKRLFSGNTYTVITWEEVDHHHWNPSNGLGESSRPWNHGEGLYQIALYILWKVKKKANKPPPVDVPSGVTKEA